METLLNFFKEFTLQIFLAAFLVPMLMKSYEEKKLRYERKANLLSALETELELMRPWAEPRYRQSSLKDYQEMNEHFDWYFPSRSIFSFNYKVVSSLLSNPDVTTIAPVAVESLLELELAIIRIYEQHDELKRYAYAFPDLYEQAMATLNVAKTKNPDLLLSPTNENYKKFSTLIVSDRLKTYLWTIYKKNFQIHVNGIGDESLTEGLSIFWKKSLGLVRAEIEEHKKSEPSFFKNIYSSRVVLWLLGILAIGIAWMYLVC